jgi:hypothetical protein
LSTNLSLNKHFETTDIFPELVLRNVAVRTVLIELIGHDHPLTILIALVEELDVIFLAVLIDMVFVSVYNIDSIHLQVPYTL